MSARPDRTALVLAAAGFFGLSVVSGFQLVLASQVGAGMGGLWRQLAVGVALWLGCIAVAPGIIALAGRFDFSPGRRVRSVAAHLLGLTLCHLILCLLTLAVAMLVGSGALPPDWSPWRGLLEILTGSRLSLSVLVYAVIAGLARATRILTALRQRELEATRLEAQAVRARLDALAARLQPHFLFNSLHAVGALMEEDPPRARVMLAELGDLLRAVLRDGGDAEIPLREELALLNRFLGIEQIRFADRLRVETAIDDDTLGVPVPRFLLQPLVENALRHGLDRRANAGSLRIAACRRDGLLRLTVWNDGAPLPATVREGFGLSATRERLATRYGAHATVTLRPAGQGGVEVVVELPIAPAAVGA